MCFVFRVCFKQKPWLILREQKRNVILHLESRNYQTWIQQCRVTTFVCVFLWVCVHIKVKIYKKMAEQAPAVFNVVCCGGVWKSQMSMQKQRAYSQSATGGTGKNRIRVCFGLFCCMWDLSKRYLGVYPEDSSLFLCGFFLLGNVPLFVSLWKQSAPCAVRMSFGDFSHFEFLLSGRWRILSFLEVFVEGGGFI